MDASRSRPVLHLWWSSKHQERDMKNLKLFSLLLLLIFAGIGAHAQNGNAVVSEVKLYDMGNGSGILAVRVSGNLAHLYNRGSFSATGDRVPGGTVGGGIGLSSRVVVVPPSPGNGNGNNGNGNGNQPVILAGVMPLSPSTGQQSDFVTVDLRVEGDGRVFWHWSFPVTTTNP